MNKSAINSFIQDMKKAGSITKVSEWMVEGRGDLKAEIKYVGVKLDQEWTDVFSPQNNLLLQFTLIKNSATLDILLANTPPFIKLVSQRLTEQDKWEPLLGKLRNQLKKDKQEYLHHRDTVGNLYAKIAKVIR